MEELGKLNIFKPRSPKGIISRIIFFGMILFILIISVICTVNAIKWINKPFAGFLMNQRNVIVTTGQYHWTGVQTEIKLQDKILKANNQPIISMRDLESVIGSVRVGDAITYSVKRGEEIIHLMIPTMRFTAMDLLLSFGFPFLSGIIYLLIGVIVFILKPDTKASWAFLLACFFLSVYTITAFDCVSTHCGFIRIYLFAETFLPAAFI